MGKMTATQLVELSIWRNPSFNRLWTAESVVFVAFQVAHFGLPLLAVLVLDASPAQLGVLSACFFLPSLVFGLAVGALADRFDRGRILIQTTVASGFCVLAVPFAAALNLLSVELLYAVGFGLGLSAVCFDAAAFAMLHGLVVQRDLVQANSRIQLSLSTARVAGPALGGLLIQWLTAPPALVVSALAYAAGAISLVSLQGPPGPTSSPPVSSLGREILEGVRFVGSHPAVRATAAYTASGIGFGAATLAILPLYAIELGLSPSALGIALAAGGLGGIVGAAFFGGAARRLTAGPAMLVSAIAIAVAQWLLPAAGSFSILAFPAIALSRFLGGLALVVYTSQMNSIQQTLTPDARQGRMFATVRVARYASAALGALLGGLIAESLGLWQANAFAAVGATISVLWLLSPALWTPVSKATGSDG